MKEDEARLRLEVLSERIRALQGHIMEVDEQISSADQGVMVLEEMAGKKDVEVLVPLINGVFVAGKIFSTDELLVNVGSGVVVKKSLHDTIEILKKQSRELREYKAKIEKEVNDLLREFEELASIIKK